MMLLEKYACEIVNTVRDPLLLLTRGARVRFANAAFYRLFGETPERVIGLPLRELGNGQWDVPELRTLLDAAVESRAAIEDLDLRHDVPGTGSRWIRLNAAELEDGGDERLVMLTMRDVTAEKDASIALHRRVDELLLERQLRNTEERFQALVEAMSEIVWVTDPMGVPIEAGSWKRLTGQGDAEIANEGWMQQIHPDDVPTMTRVWREAYASGTPFETVIRIRDARGQYRWHWSHSVPLRDDDGTIREWVGIAINIDQQRRSEIALEAANARLLAVIRTQQEIAAVATDRLAIERRVAESVRELVNADVVLIARPVGDHFEYPTRVANGAEVPPIQVPRAGTLTGWCADNRAPMRCDNLQTDPRASLRVAQDLGLRSALMVPLVNGDEVIGVLMAASRRLAAFNDEDLRTLALVAGILSSALANARAYEVLAENERRLQFQAKLLASVEQAVIASDLEGNITYWNSFAERLFGWAAHEVMGRPARSFMVPADGVEKSAAMREQIAAGTAYSGDWEFLRRDGTRFLVHSTAAPVHDAAGKATGIIAACRDISKERELQEHLQQAQKMEAVGQLAGGVAHDFNNILTAIVSYADLVHDALPDSPVRDDISEIKRAASRGADLTRQMLAFSRKQLVQPVTLDAGVVVRELEKMLRRVLPAQVELVVEAAPEPLAVLADRTQLEQVVLNLVVNARDAIEGPGRITVRATRGGTAADPELALVVSDTGCGMPPETVARMFEPFFTTKPTGRGTGLGLSVVHGIVEQMRGRIGVDSATGRGTRISISVPLTGVTVEGAQHTNGARPPAPRRSVSILLVEDNRGLLALCRRILQTQGHSVTGCDTVEGALHAARQARFDLVITDMVMPNMNGAELVETLESEGLRAPVLYMSGYTEDDVVEMSRAREHTAFLPKPFTPGELASAVVQLIG